MASKKILVQEDFVHVSSGSNPAAGFLAFYPKSDNNFYLRTSAGVERKIWDSGNHGTGSGLNADLLDGQHGSHYTDFSETLYERTRLRNENLITNGYGELGNNYNFSTFVYDASVIDSSDTAVGAMTKAGVTGSYNDELIPVDGNKYYIQSVKVKAIGELNDSTYYFGMRCFDFDGLVIDKNKIASKAGTTIGGTYYLNDPYDGCILTAPYSPSTDIDIHINDMDKWLLKSTIQYGNVPSRLNDPATNSAYFTIRLRSKVNSAGKDYGWAYMVYTQRGLHKCWTSESEAILFSGDVQKSWVEPETDPTILAQYPKAGIVHLRNYGTGLGAGQTHPVGTKIDPTCHISGDGIYNVISNQPITRDWVTWSDRFLGSDLFWLATSYIKLYITGAGSNHSRNTLAMTSMVFKPYYVPFQTADADVNLGAFSLYANQLRPTATTGTAPFVIASTTLNTNLNADLLDGYHASSFALASHTHSYLPLSGGTMSNTNLVTNLNADLLDGQHASAFAPVSHNHSFAGLTDVALVSPSAGQMLLFNGTQWVNTDHITSLPGNEYNTIQIRSKEIVDDFGNAEFYMSAEEGIFFWTNISKPDFAEVTFNKFGISSSKLTGTGERYLSADSSGIIKVATVQPTQYWQRDAGNFNVSPINPADEVHAWMFKAGGVLMSDGYLETGRSGMYTVYNDMVVSEYYQTNNTFYYANSKVAFNNSTNRLTVSGDIDAGENLLFAGQATLKAKDGGLLWISGYRLNVVPSYLLNGGYLGQIIFGTINDQGGYSQQGVIYSKATQNHSASNKGTNLEFWNTPNNTYTPRKVAELRQDGFFDSAYGFAVGGSDGQSGTATILTGCSYNSITKTLIYTRASVTFSGGIVTSITSVSSLSVPLS